VHGNNAGASWALRVKDKDNYYLFILSGPEGPKDPNKFIYYTVREGKPSGSPKINPLPAELVLKEGRSYHLTITMKKDQIVHKLEDPEGEGDTFNLPIFWDSNNTYPHGCVGFTSLGGQKFYVDNLIVEPLGTRAPR
jgi:hypothetical protein